MTGTGGRVVRIARNVVLTIGAVLGLVVLAVIVAGVAFGIRAVVITSGSMEPAIDTGSLVLTRTVPATDVQVGDVVTVQMSTGSRVTHRIVGLEPIGDDHAVLTLKGDANAAPDPQPYPVSSVDRRVLDLPLVGYFLSAMRTPVGLVVLGALAALLLLFAGSGRSARGGPKSPGGHGGSRPPAHRARHRGDRTAPAGRSVGAGAVGVLASAALLVTPSSAAWADPVDVSGTTITAHTVARPTSASCSSLLLAATVSWPGDSRYDYEVVLRRVSNLSVVSTRQVTGTSTSTTYDGLSAFGLVVGAGTVDFQVEIRSYLAGSTSWRAADVRTYTYVRVVAVLIGATVSCTT